jgi:hypothetical protein
VLIIFLFCTWTFICPYFFKAFCIAHVSPSKRDHYLFRTWSISLTNLFLSTPSVGANLWTIATCFCVLPVQEQHVYVGVRDLDLGSMINLSTRVNKT